MMKCISFGFGLLLLMCFDFSTAVAQEQLLARYIANIGPEDHYNSSGKRLTSFAALIAQDRANFHRFGIRHQHDGFDPIFTHRSMRAQISPAVLKVESYYREYINHVVSSNGADGTYIIVYVYGYGNRITRISIDVPG
ncbi:hypothetical protein J7481_11410 [Labrenzia sp. R4_2]|uniref:hypothetical protein n=1 Tax=Labrenzia sp. R4_2 TaxID=2821107 RepID=UPI001AD96002|nr:hypothetical protein [Labrenzia sp. R4_2]MBO9420105.1 hypothetical protein [Labrenzia sp. R4_2]